MSPAPLPAIGFIGIGAMGTPMVACLRRAGYAVSLYDLNTRRAGEVAAETGASTVASCADLARVSGVIITMLPNSAVVEAVLAGPDGVLAGLRSGTVLMEMSSGVPTRTRAIEPSVTAAGGTLVDAPVSGGVPRAIKGDLAIMFGGDAAVLEQVRPVLTAMGSSVIHTGSLGTAHAMKALNNLVSAGGFLVGIEALLIGSKFGLDPAVMVDALNASTGMNNSTQKKFKQFVLSREFNSGFGLDLMVKDLTIAMSVAEDVKTSVPFSRLCREMWAAAAGSLGAGLDHTDVARFSELLAGGQLPDFS